MKNDYAVKSTVTTLEDTDKATQSDEIPKQQEKYEQKIVRAEGSMIVLKIIVCVLHLEITQAKGSADTVLENYKSDFNVKIQGANHTIGDIKSSIAENRADLEDH